MQSVIRLALLLVFSIPVLADSVVPMVIARHRPMHPDESQPVTFEATAVADRVVLSYERFVLSTAPDGTHIQTPAESVVLQTCDPRGTLSSITCTWTMPVAFPAHSLVTYTARAVFDGGRETREVYSFAAGEWPWPNEPIPIRLKGSTTSKLDTVFIPDRDIEVAEFRDRLDEVIELYFKYDPILIWRGVFNFWYSGQQGGYTEFCKFEKPANYSELRAVADAIAFLHKATLRDCSNIPMMSSEIDDEKTIIHETAHTLYGLQDEYCCNTNYKPQQCAPNIYGSLADCEADAASLGYEKSNCIQLTDGTTTKTVWRIDPSTEPACIMGPNQNKATSVFRAACLRRLIWRYNKCVDGTCFPSSACP